jgi:hypothetical protein
MACDASLVERGGECRHCRKKGHKKEDYSPDLLHQKSSFFPLVFYKAWRIHVFCSVDDLLQHGQKLAYCCRFGFLPLGQLLSRIFTFDVHKFR